MPERQNLDRSLVRGIAWTSGVRWITQLLSWLATMVIARLLGPTDYGLVSMGAIVIGLAQIVAEAGFSAAIVQKHELSEDQIARLNGLSVMVGIALCALTLGLAEPVAMFFGEPAVRDILSVLSLIFLIRGFQVIPRSLLARDLKFRTWGWIDGAEAFSLTVVTLALALAGFGYWALVIGTVANSTVSTIACLRARPHRMVFPRTLGDLRDAVGFGSHVVGSSFAWYAYSNADFAVVGRVLGKGALGAYTFAWNIASIPVDRVSALVGRVTPAFFAAVQRDRPALQRYLQRLTEALAFITWPACVGLALVANEFIHVVLGPTWVAAIVPLRLLALYAALRSVMTLMPQVLVVTGHSRQSMYYSILTALVLPPVFYIGSRWGMAGVALGWLIVYPLIAVSCFVRAALKAIGMPWRDYGRALVPAAGATLAMTAGVLAVSATVPADWSPGALLATKIVTGAGIYLAILFTVYRSRVDIIARLLRGRELPRTGPAPAHATAELPDAPRLLVITYHFPPSPEVGALRWQKLVRHAAERGWGVDVITLDPAQLTRRDAGRLEDLPPGVRVFGVGSRPLLIERAVDAAWEMARPWRKRSPAGPAGRASERPHRESRGRADMRWWPPRPRELIRAWYAWMDYAREGRWARRAARLGTTLARGGLHRAVITSGPPHGVHQAGRRVSRATGLPFIMDLRDPWRLVQRLPEHVASPLWLRMAERLERRAVADASLVVTTTDPLRSAMQGVYPRAADRIITVLNGFDEEPPLSPAEPGSSRFVVAYAGSIYLDRDPRVLFRAAARAIRSLRLTPEEFGIEMMGQVSRFNGRSVERLAEEEGIGRYVRLRPPGSRAEALRFLAQASLLVVLPQDSDMAIPAKVFEYMCFDAWLLALAERGSAVELLLRDSGADVVAPGDADAIADVLSRRVAQYRQHHRPTRLSVNQRFSRAAQAEVLFGAIERIVTPPPAPPRQQDPRARLRLVG